MSQTGSKDQGSYYGDTPPILPPGIRIWGKIPFARCNPASFGKSIWKRCRILAELTIYLHLELWSPTGQSLYRKVWFWPEDIPPTLFLALVEIAPPHEVSKHATFRETSAFRTRHKAREQNPFLTQYCLDALALRRQESVKVGDRMVWAFMISRSDEAGQDVIIGSVQRIVVTQSYDILTTLTQGKHLNSPTV